MKIISMYEFYLLYQSRSDLNIIDIRDEKAYKMYHIKGAKHCSKETLLATPEKLLKKDNVYFIIDYQEESSHEICNYLDKLNYNVTRVFGGIKKWRGSFI